MTVGVFEGQIELVVPLQLLETNRVVLPWTAEHAARTVDFNADVPVEERKKAAVSASDIFRDKATMAVDPID